MTDSTADAAKLLPCPVCGHSAGLVQHPGDDDGRIWVSCLHPDCTVRAYAYDECTLAKIWNTRPQPAPPEGEPPISELADLIQGYISTTRDVASMAARAISDHLGLAARSKVEDAEVAIAARHLRETTRLMASRITAPQGLWNEHSNGCLKAADILERLATEKFSLSELLSQSSAVMQGYLDRAEAAEAKLAEREAELAKADAVIWLLANESISSGSDEKDWHEQSCNRHAARQQQKGKPND